MASWLMLGVVVTACGYPSEQLTTPVTGLPATDTSSLRSIATTKGRLIGSAIDRGFRYSGSDGAAFRTNFARGFSGLTPQNDLKFERIHTGRGVYRFEPSDALVGFAEANSMKVRGHNLVWDQQLSSWLTSGSWTPDEARTLLVEHVTKAVSP